MPMNIQKIIDYIFPDSFSCLLCGQDIFDETEFVCVDCFHKLPLLNGKLCVRCSHPVVTGDYCENCKGKDFVFSKVIAPFIYTDYIKHCIHELKFNDKKYFAKFLGYYLAKTFNLNKLPCDIVIPVPLSKQRLQTRKYNQAELIARTFCETTNLPLATNVLVKIKDVSPQAKLSFKDRSNNIKGAYKVIDPSQIIGKNVLVIDDVYTTGCTMNECSKMLKKAGAKQVFGATGGHSILPQPQSEVVATN